MGGSAERSVKGRIERALVALLARRPLLEITVSDLVREAQVSRMSFYRHYSSISDVVEEAAGRAAELFAAEIIPPPGTREEARWRDFLLFLFRRVARAPGEYALATGGIAQTELFRGHVERRVAALLAAQSQITLWELYSWVGKQFLLQGVVQSWLAAGMRETPEEMCDYLLPILSSF